jgi:hypothetical protein
MSHTYRRENPTVVGLLNAAYAHGAADQQGRKLPRPRDQDYPPTYRSAYRQGWFDSAKRDRATTRALPAFLTLVRS